MTLGFGNNSCIGLNGADNNNNGNGEGGTTVVSANYNEATNKPSINGVTLIGNKTTKDLKIEAGPDLNGIRGDYAVKYGIVETANGLPTFNAADNEIIIPEGLSVIIPGNTDITTIAKTITYAVTSNTDFTLFLMQSGSLFGAETLFWQEKEPNGSANTSAWWKPDPTTNGGQWYFKTNDTGNIFREDTGTPIANVKVTNGVISDINFVGCRILDKQIFVKEEDLTALSDKIETVGAEVETNTANITTLSNEKQDQEDSTLSTTNKTIVGAINELEQMSKFLAVDITNLQQEKQNVTDEGLETTAKEIVPAINELKSAIDAGSSEGGASTEDVETLKNDVAMLQHDVENLSDTKQDMESEELQTTVKTIVGAINELKTAVANLSTSSSDTTENPFYYGMSIYSDIDPQKDCWLLADGTAVSGDTYPDYWAWVLQQYNSNYQQLSFKAPTMYKFECNWSKGSTYAYIDVYVWLNSATPKADMAVYSNVDDSGDVSARFPAWYIGYITSVDDDTFTFKNYVTGEEVYVNITSSPEAVTASDNPYIHTPYDFIVDVSNKTFQLPTQRKSAMVNECNLVPYSDTNRYPLTQQLTFPVAGTEGALTLQGSSTHTTTALATDSNGNLILSTPPLNDAGTQARSFEKFLTSSTITSSSYLTNNMDKKLYTSALTDHILSVSTSPALSGLQGFVGYLPQISPSYLSDQSKYFYFSTGLSLYFYVGKKAEENSPTSSVTPSISPPNPPSNSTQPVVTPSYVPPFN